MVGDQMGEKVVSVSFRSTEKITAAVLKKLLALVFLKGGGKILYHMTSNKESIHKLAKEGSQIQGIEVTKGEIKGFDHYARKYHLQYSLVREKNDKNQYFFSFRAKDMDLMRQAASDYLKDETIDHGGLKEKIEHARAEALDINKSREQEKSKEQIKTKGRNRSRER